MLAYRWTWIMKRGGIQQALKVTTETLASLKKDYAKVRSYTPKYSPEVYVFELVVENEEAKERWFAEFNAAPGADAYWEKWFSVAERLVTRECWIVTEQA